MSKKKLKAFFLDNAGCLGSAYAHLGLISIPYSLSHCRFIRLRVGVRWPQELLTRKFEPETLGWNKHLSFRLKPLGQSLGIKEKVDSK